MGRLRVSLVPRFTAIDGALSCLGTSLGLQEPTVSGSNVRANPAASPAPLNEKIPENLTTVSVRFPGISVSVPPVGLEPTTR
jgi:hypothetical protein